MALKMSAGRASGRGSYFAHLTFKDSGVRELVSGIESILSNPQADFKLREDILQNLAGVIGNAIHAKLIRPEDYKPRWFKGTAYEQYLKETLGDINRKYELGIRV
ncbi:hypothetical protein J4448_00230 [Candidatus Woesearchaeota archaeon]|nr:hypothetical protein [Candidatus Woesearchaeota archaeon]